MKILAALALVLVACGGAVAPSEPPSIVVDVDAGDPCASMTTDEWCALVARGGVNVDPRADKCCTTWISDR